jgi:GNAT superfamily N-acetyltransferase
MRVTYRELGPAEFRAGIRELVGVYAATMNPPERMLPGRASIMERHAAGPGFRGLAAFADGRLAGFTYGFHGESGQWWHDMVASALATRSGAGIPFPGFRANAYQGGELGTSGLAGSGRTGTRVAGNGYAGNDAGQAWLDDSLEIAELHVLPAFQGAGIGFSLLLSLSDGRPERTAVLSTADAPTRARRLYREVGFTDLLTGFRFSGTEPPYAVMGALLPLAVTRPPVQASGPG